MSVPQAPAATAAATPADARSAPRACPNGNVIRPVCHRRDCEVCGPRWAADQWRVMSENLRHYGGSVTMVAITPPGIERLPWACRRSHKHSGPRGCRVQKRAARDWCDTFTLRLGHARRAGNAYVRRHLCTCGHTRRSHSEDGCACCGCERFAGFVPNLLERVSEPQLRGVPHAHFCFGVETELERRAVRLWVAWLRAEERCSCGRTRRWHEAGGQCDVVPEQRSPTYGWTRARQYDFGFVDGHLQAVAPEDAARYLASYLTGRSKHKPSIRQNIIDPAITYWAVRESAARGSIDQPRPRRYSLPLVWVSPRLSSLKRGGTGVTMRALRCTRQLFSVLRGTYQDDQGNTQPKWMHEVRSALEIALVYRRTRRRARKDDKETDLAVAALVSSTVEAFEALPPGYERLLQYREAMRFVRLIAEPATPLRLVHDAARELPAAA